MTEKKTSNATGSKTRANGKAAADRMKDSAKDTENGAAKATGTVKTSAQNGAAKVADETSSAASAAGAAVKRTAHAAAGTAQATGRTVAAAPKKAAVAAGTTWALIRARKALAAAGGAGVALVGATVVFARQRAQRRRGPLARLTGGRLGS
ncbi:hypothetical protein ABZW18_01775 [Streptomyces sp. NPDC004647]|uniref:hypothetical protein n=1 Tax=Streptomyces sp. NPDC004647 TaxID=3154671 RepID=UPI0033AEE0B5